MTTNVIAHVELKLPINFPRGKMENRQNFFNKFFIKKQLLICDGWTYIYLLFDTVTKKNTVFYENFQ